MSRVTRPWFSAFVVFAMTLTSLVLVNITASAAIACPSFGSSLCAVGQNLYGELGDGDTAESMTYVAVQGGPSLPLRSMAAAIYHSLAVGSDGAVWAWGRNQDGELGNGSFTATSTVPVQVSGLDGSANVVAVATSVQAPYSLALKADGTVLAWGSFAGLGTGETESRATPAAVAGLGPGSGVIAIAAGTEALALKADGTVLAWGGDSGHLTPEPVSGLGSGSGVTAISSFGFSMALKSDGTVVAWGSNAFGQLGDGSGNSSGMKPVQVSGLGPGSNVIGIAAGELHGMALRSNGQVLSWGSGSAGALGTGDGASSPVPVEVKGLGAGSGVVRIAAGGGDSFAITTSGSVLGWGNNVSSEVANEEEAGSFVYEPRLIGNSPEAKVSVAAGYYHTLVGPVLAVGTSQSTSQLKLTATPTEQVVGGKITLLATGAGAPGTLVRFEVISGPDLGFTALVAADNTGSASTLLSGKSAGTDQAVAWLDDDRDGVIGQNEPSATASVSFHYPATVNYVAMGDSYSSGEGIDPYFRDGFNMRGVQPGSIDNRCHRSTRAYAEYVQPPGFAKPLYEIASDSVSAGQGKRLNKFGSDSNVRTSGGVGWAFIACSGATTRNVLQAADGGTRQSWSDGYRDQVPQLDNTVIDASTGLVTLTIGGDDVHFADVLKYCASTDCNQAGYVANLNQSIEQSGSSLIQVFRAIKEKASNARIIALGYPQIFPSTPQEQGCTKLRPWRGEQDMLRAETVKLNDQIGAAAAAAGIEFVEVASSFSGHEVCGSLGEWINGPSQTYKLNRTFVDDESFHPNSYGQRDGYAAVLNAVLAGR